MKDYKEWAQVTYDCKHLELPLDSRLAPVEGDPRYIRIAPSTFTLRSDSTDSTPAKVRVALYPGDVSGTPVPPSPAKPVSRKEEARKRKARKRAKASRRRNRR